MAAWPDPVCVCIVHCIGMHCIGSASLYSELYTHTHRVTIRCRNIDHVHVNGHDRIILVILAKYCVQGSLMMDPLWSETCRSTFKHFIMLIVTTNYILVHQLDNKVFECHWCTVQTWRSSNPVFLHTCPPMKTEQCVPKRRHIKFRRRGITQKKPHNIQNTAKVWNQGWSSQILSQGSSQLNPIPQSRTIHGWAYIKANRAWAFHNHNLVSGNTTPSDIIAVLGVKPYRCVDVYTKIQGYFLPQIRRGKPHDRGRHFRQAVTEQTV